MSAQIRTARVEGMASFILENELLRVTVIPELGGHIYELIDLAASQDLLWHNDRTRPRPAPYGAVFDDWWSGGWDEIFPSGDHGTLHGESLPYMGELWCVPWSAEARTGSEEVSLTTVGIGTIAPVRFERTLTIHSGEPAMHVAYRIESLDVRPLPFTWGIHPAFAVTPHHRIDHSGNEMLVGVSSDASMGMEGETYNWPNLPFDGPDGVLDVRRCRARDAAVFGGHWVRSMPEGWLALTDATSRRGVVLAFDPKLFRHAWLWQVYGGWRGHHHVALEPWTAYPQAVDEAEAAGRAHVLAPGETLVTTVAVCLTDGLDSVRRVDLTGPIPRAS